MSTDCDECANLGDAKGAGSDDGDDGDGGDGDAGGESTEFDEDDGDKFISVLIRSLNLFESFSTSGKDDNSNDIIVYMYVCICFKFIKQILNRF